MSNKQDKVTKLPKQWEHWCKLAGLKPHSKCLSRERSKLAWLYLKGRGRVWRINNEGMFQCGDTYEKFDRLALCDIVEELVPQSRDKFLSSVSFLLNLKNNIF